MKKCALLLLIVLTLSTGAWASTLASVKVSPPCPSCSDDVWINVLACVSKQANVVDVRPCVQNNMIFVDIYLQSTGSCIGSTKVNEWVDVLDLCPGPYWVVAKVYLSDGPCGCTPQIVALGSTYFTVHSCFPCWPW